MSRSENTTPYRLWAPHGLTYHRPLKRYRFGHHSVVSKDVRLASRQQRRIAREELRRGVEPEPYRPRRGVRCYAM